MIVDTGANVTIMREDIAQQRNEKIIWTPPCVTLQTVTGDKIPIIGKMNIKITFGNNAYSYTVYVAKITDNFILGLDFLEKYDFILDFKDSSLHSTTEDVTLFRKGGYTDQEKNFRLGVLEFPDFENFPKGVLLASTLVDITKEAIPVRCANVSDKQKIIKKGKVLATCTPVTYLERSSFQTSNVSSENLTEDLLKTTELTQKQRSAAEKMLREFKELFPKSSEEFGRTNLTKHRIDTGNHPPIKQHPRRLPFAKVEEVKDLLKDMQAKGIIEPSTSPWASPIILVRKKDGSTRFCVDYRRLNDITKKDSYPLPRIDDILDTLSGNVWFSTLDLKSGYWQVEMDPLDREKTAFTTSGQGLWQFKVTPFGLSNAPATFERLMETVLRGLSPEACVIYLDDIIIVGRDFEEQPNNLRKVLEKLKQANLKLNPAKCNLFRREVSYLGHIISAEGVRTDPRKVAVVKEWSQPRNVHELRSILGLCTYYRRFVKGFSLIARPLHRLTEHKRPFVWSEECEVAFTSLKEVLTSAPILSYPDPDKQFILDTDASHANVGAVLSQEIDGQERVIAYWTLLLPHYLSITYPTRPGLKMEMNMEMEMNSTPNSTPANSPIPYPQGESPWMARRKFAMEMETYSSGLDEEEMLPKIRSLHDVSFGSKGKENRNMEWYTEAENMLEKIKLYQTAQERLSSTNVPLEKSELTTEERDVNIEVDAEDESDIYDMMEKWILKKEKGREPHTQVDQMA
ncbi:retrovirus-related Pol polyprotein from transposon 17.6 [Nephila pilipes]|uniref:RNA-directed DNA polymerase n=1 Tax=Nephila pilipes TaxID=299642 RepID=A0A8X6N881_NEPPI|nr:retrovirus-related Pol polyprotein from transposon 17.6 [Nephila pilipes]